jgi:hypothetical protein
MSIVRFAAAKCNQLLRDVRPTVQVSALDIRTAHALEWLFALS